MTGNRIRIVGLQAVIVGALLLVVYLTLLRPEEHKPLFGVTAPGQVAQAPNGASEDQPGAAAGGRGGGPGAHGDRGGAANRQGGKAQAGTQGGSSAVAGAGVGEAAALPSPTRDDGGSPTLTPSEEQYGDTVSRLFGNL
jgi:hypothetical protein